MKSEKLHNLAEDIAAVLDRHRGSKRIEITTIWLRQTMNVLDDCANQVEAMEAAEQLNIHARDALVHIFNDAARWLERAREANAEAAVKALAADNAP